MINDWAGEARREYFEFLDSSYAVEPNAGRNFRIGTLMARYGLTKAESFAIEDDWEIKRHEKKLAADAGLKGPITLNTDDWLVIHDALDDALAFYEDKNTIGGRYDQRIRSLERIKAVIGSRGENAAKYGCTKADGTR